MALGILHGAQRLGIRVPEELSVVGVDDFPEGSHFWPPLTTVYQPQRDAGAVAVADLDGMIRAKRQPRRTDLPRESLTRLPPELIVRASSRPVHTKIEVA
jgi:LacI family transcriptional regulator